MAISNIGPRPVTDIIGEIDLESDISGSRGIDTR